jgi:uncharacterized protein DUF6221
VSEEEAVKWLRGQVTQRLEQARRADTGDRWEADRHYDALYCVDMKPSAGPVASTEDLREASLDLPEMHDFENPRFLWACTFQARHAALNDPQDVIARCQAELAILDAYEEACKVAEFPDEAGGFANGLEEAVKLLAGGYKHREGYAEHWA